MGGRLFRNGIILGLIATGLGAEVRPEANIFATVSNAAELHTLTRLLKIDRLEETLTGPGPFTLFAPINDAFTNLPFGTVDVLGMPEHEDVLVKVLRYHLVEGRLTTPILRRRIEEGHGTASIRTVGGHTLWLSLENEIFHLRDELGNTSNLTQLDIKQSNGVIHVMDAVVLPR